MRWVTVVGVVVIANVCMEGAGASERRFAYTYESDVLGPEQIELEPWTTVRLGRAELYRRFDERLELEIGLTSRLQTSLYLNLSAIGQGPASARTNELEFEGVSSEWKFKLTDPVADALGAALYLELTATPLEAELEGKLIFDKRLGEWLAAVNIVTEQEWSIEEAHAETETTLEIDAGLARLIARAWSVGLEARSVSVLGAEGSSVLFAGPVVSYAARSWWAALAVQPQLVALRGATKGGLNLDEHERVEARLLVGARL